MVKTKRTREQIKKLLINYLNKHKGLAQKQELMKVLGLQSDYLDDILEELSLVGTIVTAKSETISNGKKVTHSYSIHLITK